MKFSFAFSFVSVSLLTPILGTERKAMGTGNRRARRLGGRRNKAKNAWRFDQGTQINRWINEFERSQAEIDALGLQAGFKAGSLTPFFVLTTLVENDVILFEGCGCRFPATEAVTALADSSGLEQLVPDACGEGATGLLGYNGEFTELICSVHEKLIEFWAQSPDLQGEGVTGESDLVVDVKGLHGTLLEAPQVIPVLKALANVTDQQIGLLQSLFAGGFVPRGYNNELLTIKKARYWGVQVCLSETNGATIDNTNPMIMWGDGYLESLRARRFPPAIAIQAEHANRFTSYLWQTYINPEPFECPAPDKADPSIAETQVAYVEGDDALDSMKFIAMQAYFVAHNRGLDWNVGLFKKKGRRKRIIKKSDSNVPFCKYAKVMNDRYNSWNTCAIMFAAQTAVYHGDEIRLYDLFDDIEENFRLIFAVDPSVCKVKVCRGLFY